MSENLRSITVHLFCGVYGLLPSLFLRRALLRAIGVIIPNSSVIHYGMHLYSLRGRVTMGEGSIINRHCTIDNRGQITVGRNVMIGHRVSLYTATHDFNSRSFAAVIQSIEIGDNVVIFPNSLIMPGAVIGEGAVVLPGAVVSGKVGEYSVVGGVPARQVSTRCRHIDYSLKYSVLYPVV